MTRETRIWLIVMLLGAAGLIGRAVFSEDGMGREYTRVAPLAANSPLTQENPSTYGAYLGAERANPGQTQYKFSVPRTIGLWLAAFFTLATFSFLYRDNPFYKFAESVLVGVSAAYWMVVGFWDVLVPNLIGKIWPSLVQAWAMPGLTGPEAQASPSYIVPLVLGVLLLWRLSPKGGWIARWPLAFIIGTTAGLRLIGFLHGDFLVQIRNTVLPLVVMDAGSFDFWGSVQNLLTVVSVLCCLVYFFFSFEHKGAIGVAAKAGIWVLMITFGAAFGYTVMGRIALLAIRFEFLLDDWLWLIDPSAHRVVGLILFGN